MKRQNSPKPGAAKTVGDDDHSRNTANDIAARTKRYPQETSSKIMTPYNRLGSHNNGGGRRRKKLGVLHNSTTSSAAAEIHSSTLPAAATNSSNNSPPTNYDTAPNNSSNTITEENNSSYYNSSDSDDDDDDTSKKKRKKHHHPLPPRPNSYTLVFTLYHYLSSKVRAYRKKLSNLSPRQKLMMCIGLILWKFIQAWLIVRGVVWLSSERSGGGATGREGGESVVKVGKSMEQRMKLDGELREEIELLRKGEEEGRLEEEEQLWMEEEEEELKMQGEEEEEEEVEQRIEETMEMMATKRILYMLTVTCDTRQYPREESSSSSPQQQDGTNNNNNGKNLNSAKNNNIDNILSTLSTNIQTMIDHIPQQQQQQQLKTTTIYNSYAVDVYWILGCSWSDYYNNFQQQQHQHSFPAGKLTTEDEDVVSEYWKVYIAQQLPEGVGVQVWEDAMPLDYFYSYSSNEGGGKGGETPNLVGGSGGGGGVRGFTLTNQLGQTQQQQDQTPRLAGVVEGEEEEEVLQSKTAAVPPRENKKGEEGHSTVILTPSIEKFMKQHRYVVRDKLDYYDVFLSFGASLQHQQQYQSSGDSGLPKTGELIQVVNGTNVEFCTKNLYRDTEISCNERVEYLTKRYHISESEAMISLLKGKDCTCNTDGKVGGGDLEAKPGSHSLERITGDHIDTYLTMSSELHELQNGQHNIIPGFISVGAVPVATAAANESTNDSGSQQQFHVDATPCCEDITSRRKDSMELTVETTKGVTINADEWQMMKVATDSRSDGARDKTKEESSPKWIAVGSKSSDATATPTFKFYEDGWILTKDQLLRLDYGINRGKFLPPFTSDNGANDAVRNISIQRKGLLASPMFESRENGGFDLRRAVSLDPNQLSRQLVHPVSTPASGSSLISNNESLGVKELLRQFHKTLKRRRLTQ